METRGTCAAGANFVRVPQDEWCLSDQMDRGQKERLLREVTYEQIVARLTEEIALVNHGRERACSKRQFFRARVTLSVHPSTVDAFHNAASGYRAQYYQNIRNGDRANAYALRHLAPRVRELLMGHAKRTCPWWWIEKSLLDSDAKLWIHQGHWLRYAKRTDRHLAVARWVKQQASPDEDRQKKAIWASLTPGQETRIDLKGGFLTLAGEPLGGLKPTRAQDIHELGFT